jgi:hypothetical protein
MFLVATGFALLLGSPAHAQGGVPLVTTVATDQSSLNLSNQFGVPTGTAINQAGDFAFIGNGDSALFFRPSGASTATRILQVGDTVSGFPASQILSFSPTIRLNSTKLLFFAVIFSLQDGLVHEALLTYDGTNYHTVASSDDIAPGSVGATYGTNLLPVGINDGADVAFTAAISAYPLNPLTTLYIAPSKRAAVRVVGSGDTLPQPQEPCPPAIPSCFTVGTPFQALAITSGINARSEVLFKLGNGLFVGSATVVSPVTMANNGPCSSPSFLSEGVLNNSGTVAFTNSNYTASAICIAPAGGSPSIPAVTSGSSAPPPIANWTLASFFPLAINDAGDILFQSRTSGGAPNVALLRYRHSAGLLDVVAYDGEPAPGAASGSTFASILSPASMANDGRVSFKVYLTQGRYAIYEQSAADAPALIALGGQPAPSSVGGTFHPSGFTPIQALDNGSTFFGSGIASGTAYFAEFLRPPAPGSIQPLMSTADSLPQSSRVSFFSARPKAAGHFVAFAAQEAGGPISLFESDTSSGGTTARVVSEGDAAPGAGGVIASTFGYSFFVNAKGQVAFEAPMAGGASAEGIFIWSQLAGLTKVAATGESSPIAGKTFLSVSLSERLGSSLIDVGVSSIGSGSTSTVLSTSINPVLSSLLNDAGQLAFSSTVISGTTSSGAVFLYDPSGTISKIVVTGDPASGGETFVAIASAKALNSTSQVAFEGYAAASPTALVVPSGLFIGSAGAMPQRVGLSSSVFPSGSFDIFSGLADGGELAFDNFSISSPTNQPGFGVFTGDTGGTVQTIAVNGGAAPGGGTFSLGTTYTTGTTVSTVFTSIAQIDRESDVALRGGITGDTSDSGYFRLMQTGPAAGKLLPVVLQGQSVPGGGTFDTIPFRNSIGANFALGPDGELAFVNSFTSASGGKHGLFVARTDGTVVRVLATGDIEPGGGTVDLLAMIHGLGAGEAGKFAFWAGIQGGSARQAIFVTTIPPGIATTTAMLALPQAPVIALQPVTLTATVSSSTGAATGTPTGLVNFFDNSTSMGSIALHSTTGKATLMTSSLVGGPHSLIAQYDGDANFAPADSPAVNTVVTGFAASPTGLTVTAGQSVPIPLVLYASAGSSFNFMLSCSGLPAKASCAFDQNQVTPGPTGTPIKVTLSTMGNSNLLPHRPRKGPGPLGLLELSAILSLLLSTALTKLRLAPRRRLAFGMCIAAFGLLALMTGCGTVGSGSTGPSGTPPGPATITVTATSSTATVSTVVNVTVQ